MGRANQALGCVAPRGWQLGTDVQCSRCIARKEELLAPSGGVLRAVEASSVRPRCSGESLVTIETVFRVMTDQLSAFVFTSYEGLAALHRPAWQRLAQRHRKRACRISKVGSMRTVFTRPGGVTLPPRPVARSFQPGSSSSTEWVAAQPKSRSFI